MAFSENHIQVKYYTQAVHDYLGVVNRGKDGDAKAGETRVIAGNSVTLDPNKDKAEAKVKAFDAMKKLQSIVRNPKAHLSNDDKREIAGTWRDFNNTFQVDCKPPQRMVLKKKPWQDANYKGPLPVEVAHGKPTKGPKPVRIDSALPHPVNSRSKLI